MPDEPRTSLNDRAVAQKLYAHLLAVAAREHGVRKRQAYELAEAFRESVAEAHRAAGIPETDWSQIHATSDTVN